MEPIADHPVQHLIDVGALQNAVAGCPADGLLLSDEDLRLVAGLGKGFLCGDAIAMNVVAPHRKRLRDDDVLRRCTYESGDMWRRRRQYVPRGRQGSALGSGCIWHRVFLPAGDETKQSHRVAKAALAASGLGCSQFTVGLRFYSDAIPPNRGGVPCGGLSARWRGRCSRGADVASAGLRADAGARGRWWGRAGCSLVACTGLRTRCRTGRWRRWRTGGANITGGRLRATCAGLRGAAGAARGRWRRAGCSFAVARSGLRARCRAAGRRGWRAGVPNIAARLRAARAGLRTDPAVARAVAGSRGFPWSPRHWGRLWESLRRHS